MIGWNFPSNNHGQEVGLSDAGIETFKGNPLEGLAREIGQNSCDAAMPGSLKPVEIHFDLFYIPIDRFPGIDEYTKVLESCLDYWNENKKSVKFFEKALEVLNSKQIPILKISDYNTIGLTGSDKDHGTHWHKLTKSTGASDKGSTSGGSFGIGKHAVFACSKLRTVFYGTYDSEEKTAFQGVARLVTHKNALKETTQGIGYYGIMERNRPIYDLNSVDKMFHRSQVGTDVFVAGFTDEEGWKSSIIKSVLENFFVAISENRLMVKVCDTLINSSNLPDLLEKYANKYSECLAGKYFKALTFPERHHFFEDNFEGLGRIDLFVLTAKNYPKRVAMVRASGMKIYDKDRFRTPLKFAGVMLAKGEEINEFLRSIEPPSHNDWQPERHDDPKFAKKIVSKLNSWLHEKVKSISELDESEELDVEGINQYLPDDLDESLIIDNEQAEGEKGPPVDVEIETIIKNTISNISAVGSEVAATTDESEGANNAEGTANNGDNGAPKTEAGQASNNEGDDGFSPNDEGKECSKKNRRINLKYKRAYSQDPATGVYNLLLETENDEEGYLSITVVGEEGEEPAQILTAYDLNTGKSVNINSTGKIGPSKFKADKRYSYKLILGYDSKGCALEVYLIAD